MENHVTIENQNGNLKDSEESLEVGDFLTFSNWLETETE